MAGEGYADYLCAEDPEDWFYFVISSLERIVVDAMVPANADYDVYLYRDPEVLFPYGSKTGDGLAEHIEYQPHQIGAYQVRVTRAAGAHYSATEPYLLTVNYR